MKGRSQNKTIVAKEHGEKARLSPEGRVLWPLKLMSHLPSQGLALSFPTPVLTGR
jgi:hypothetical protein